MRIKCKLQNKEAIAYYYLEDIPQVVRSVSCEINGKNNNGIDFYWAEIVTTNTE